MEQPEAGMGVILDGDMSTRKLVALIRHGAEEDGLDYKGFYDLSNSKHKVELAADVVAMANTSGGYIVIGIRESGVSTNASGQKYIAHGLSEEEVVSLDISSVCSQVESFIGCRTNLRLQAHALAEFQNKRFVLLFVPQNNELPVVFTKEGKYKENKHDTVKFRDGEIFVRRGAASVRANQSDIRRITSHIRSREKEQWTEDILRIKPLRDLTEALIARIEGEGAPNLEQLMRRNRFSEEMLYVDSASFERHITDLLERDNLLGIKRYLENAVEIFTREAEVTDDANIENIRRNADNRLIPIVDNLTTVGIVAIKYQYPELFKDAVMSLKRLYDRAPSITFPEVNEPDFFFDYLWVWEAVTARIYILGALIIKNKIYTWMPELVFHYGTNLHTGQKRIWSLNTGASLHHVGRLASFSLCPKAIQTIKNNNYFWSLFERNEDTVVSTVCQYDFLSGLYLLKEGSSNVHPSFGAYYNRRTEPIVSELVRDTPARRAFSDVSDHDLAKMINELDHLPPDVLIFHSVWDRNDWQDPVIRDFMKNNLDS